MNKIAKNVATVYIGDLINNENKIKQSNLKRPTSNSAITLIALIITIIALLILAGVTLNMMMGENGIINRAQLAKEKTDKAQEDEKIKIKDLEDELNNYNTRGNEKIEDYTDDLIYKLNLNNLQNQQGVTVNGNVVVSSDNKYATFNGNSYINVANNIIDPNSNLRTEPNVSLCCWYRTTESKNAVFMEYGENTTSYIHNVHYLFNKDSNIAAGQGYATCDRIINPSNRYDGKWHFVVAIFENNDTVTLYYDGVPFQTKGSYSASNSYLNIGGVSDMMPTWGYIGDLSDIRIYKNVLSEEKVKQLLKYGKQELGI